jgi:hypothetical protein
MRATGPERALFLRATLAEQALEGSESIQVSPRRMVRGSGSTHARQQQMGATGPERALFLRTTLTEQTLEGSESIQM